MGSRLLDTVALIPVLNEMQLWKLYSLVRAAMTSSSSYRKGTGQSNGYLTQVLCDSCLAHSDRYVGKTKGMWSKMIPAILAGLQA